jgi:hypothetical protein
MWSTSSDQLNDSQTLDADNEVVLKINCTIIETTNGVWLENLFCRMGTVDS